MSNKDLLIPNIPSIRPGVSISSDRQQDRDVGANKGEFAKFLQSQITELQNDPAQTSEAISGGAVPLQFSKHALQRAQERGVPITKDLVSSLEKAVADAGAKGSKNTLILGGDAAFVVSVKNNTVVTVVDKANMQNNVFTNIDSTVVM